jgi:hypothetical protein
MIRDTFAVDANNSEGMSTVHVSATLIDNEEMAGERIN